MVLTRASYSRLGTPLASPLNNPDRPPSSQQNRTTRTRNSLSSSASFKSHNNTPSSEPPHTPSQLQFAFDLIDKLVHQQDLSSQSSNYFTPPSTSNPIGLSSPPLKELSSDPLPPIQATMGLSSDSVPQPQTSDPIDHHQLLDTLLKRAKEKARSIELRAVPTATTELGASGTSDGGSSVTLQNIIRLDGQEKLNLPLSRPLRPSLLALPPAHPSLNPPPTHKNNPYPTPDNLERVSSIRDHRLGFDFSSNHLPRSSFQWHDLPVQELSRETKMEIQAMRLHRTLDPKSFVKGGIEKSLKEPMPTKFLFGHIIDGTTNGGSQPSTKKRSFVDNLVQDEKSQEWAKKKYNLIQTVSGKNSGGKNFYKRVKENRLK